MDIPSVLTNPCYYGDSSDNVIYDGGNRGGYWEEAYTVRDAETGKGTTVVDVPNEVEKRNEDELYVNTTIYDYYSDYELNGLNRDNYQSNIPVNSHRIYQPFRQFNMAVSDYYQVNGATSPLYWGNFQNYNDATDFKNIAGTMNLFGYPNSKDDSNLYQKFFYENNSMWGSDGNKLSSGNNATQGLVADQLNNNSLQLKTDSGTALAPFFDKDFLNGNNSKNTVLGKVYENVTFPFVKKAMRSSSTESTGTLDYWYFNSADKEATNKNLQLKYDATDEYFLQSNNEEVKGMYTVKDSKDDSTKVTTITITFNSDKYCKTLDPNTTQNFTITYTATLNKDAVLGQSGNTNDVFVTYRNTGDVDRDTEHKSTTKVFTYGIDLLKKGEGVDKLVGVKFKLTDGNDNVVSVEKKGKNTFYTPGGDSNEVETGADGKIYIRGLKPGTYKLTETKTNAGYVLLKDPVVIVIKEDNAIGGAEATVGSKPVTMQNDQKNSGSKTAEVPLTVVNSKGFDLPATGGRGIALFTIAGIAIVAAAGSLLFMRKRSK